MLLNFPQAQKPDKRALSRSNLTATAGTSAMTGTVTMMCPERNLSLDRDPESTQRTGKLRRTWIARSLHF